jgi:WD40 repeat protein
VVLLDPESESPRRGSMRTLFAAAAVVLVLLAAGLVWGVGHSRSEAATDVAPPPPAAPAVAPAGPPAILPPAPVAAAPPVIEARVLTGHTQLIEQVEFTPDGSRVVSVSQDGLVIVWDPSAGRAVREIPTGEKPLCCAVTPDGKRVIAGTSSGRLIAWSIETGEEALRFRTDERSKEIRYVVVTRDGKRVVSVGGSRDVMFWDAATGDELRRLPGHGSRLWAVAVSPDGAWIASGGGDWGVKGDRADDFNIRVWNAQTGALAHELAGHSDDVRRLDFSPDSRRLLSAGFDNALRVWEVSSGKLLSTINGPPGYFKTGRFLPDGRRVLGSGGTDNRRLPSGAPRLSDHTIRVWDEAGKELLCLSGHTDGVLGVALSLDGKLLASGSHDRTVRLWPFPLGGAD